jgi:DNA ligase-1
LVVRYTGSGVVFQVGSGFTDAQRREIWDNQSAYLGKMATVKYQEFSALGVPRFPVFKGFRGD